MAIPRPPTPVTLIVGMLAANTAQLDDAEAALAAIYSPVDFRSPNVDFDFTDYYEREMGPGLKRRLISFADEIDPGNLAAIKLRTNEIEADFARRSGPRRPVNLDPGYVCGSKLVLASAKDRAHRLYLGAGIYAEITLDFRKGRFTPLETTYPDYRSADYIRFFTEVRSRHLARAGRAGDCPAEKQEGTAIMRGGGPA